MKDCHDCRLRLKCDATRKADLARKRMKNTYVRVEVIRKQKRFDDIDALPDEQILPVYETGFREEVKLD